MIARVVALSALLCAAAPAQVGEESPVAPGPLAGSEAPVAEIPAAETPAAEVPAAEVPVAAERAESPGAGGGLELPSYGDRFVRMLWTLGLMLLALFVAAKLLPRFLRGRGDALFGAGRHVQVVERVRLDGRQSLYLIRIHGRYMLLGGTDQRLQVLAGEDLDADAIRAAEDRVSSPHAGAPARSDFAQRLLRRARGGTGGDR